MKQGTTTFALAFLLALDAKSVRAMEIGNLDTRSFAAKFSDDQN